MAKMNYSRPNKGYETESWRRNYNWVDAKPKQYQLGACENHRAEVRIMNYGRQQPVLWCKNCNKHILSLSWNDYNWYKRNEL